MFRQLRSQASIFPSCFCSHVPSCSSPRQFARRSSPGSSHQFATQASMAPGVLKFLQFGLRLWLKAVAYFGLSSTLASSTLARSKKVLSIKVGNFKDVPFCPILNFGHFRAALLKMSVFYPTRNFRQLWKHFFGRRGGHNVEHLPHPKNWPFFWAALLKMSGFTP